MTTENSKLRTSSRLAATRTRSRKSRAITPGELLRRDFLDPLGVSSDRLAEEIFVPTQRICEIIRGKRAVTADIDLRLCRFFGLSDGYWLRAQAAFDIEVAQTILKGTLQKIKPWSEK